MSNLGKTPSSSTCSDDLIWAIDVVETAAVLIGERGEVTHANSSSRALAARIRPRAAPEHLLALLSDSSWEAARRTGCWAGELAAAPGVVLKIRLYHGERDGVPRGLATFEDVQVSNARQIELQQRHDELLATHQRLEGAQEQLLQSEKMASIGQLAAGVAHEINNPIGYVHSNLGTLQEYAGALLAMVACFDDALRSDDPAAHLDTVRGKRERLDIDHIVGDLPKLLEESREGIEHVIKIVQDLKDFSRSGWGEPMRPSDLHKGLESTLNIVWNDLKYKVHLEKHYGVLPLVECHPSEINQVLMSLLINAGQAIENRGSIVIATGAENGEAWINIADTGCGIAPDALQRIFEPFYTTKPIGRGTGLGLAIAYGIMAKHHGRIEVSSRPGMGSAFRVVLPVVQPQTDADNV